MGSIPPDQVSGSADLGEHVRLAQDQQVVAVHGDLRAAVLRVEDLVALGDVERDALLAVLVPPAVAGCQDLAALRLLLGGVGEDDAAGGRLLLLDRLDDHAIAQGLQLHCAEPPSGVAGSVSWHSRVRSASAWHSSKLSAKSIPATARGGPGRA